MMKLDELTMKGRLKEEEFRSESSQYGSRRRVAGLGAAIHVQWSNPGLLSNSSNADTLSTHQIPTPAAFFKLINIILP